MNNSTDDVSVTSSVNEQLLPQSRSSSVSGKNFRGRRKCVPIQVETLRQIDSGEHESFSAMIIYLLFLGADETSTDSMPFYSGNPFVEKTNGILHIYKKKWIYLILCFFV